MSTVFDLSLDIKLIILNHLDNRTLVQLSKTCTYFAKLVKSLLSFNKIRVKLIQDLVPNTLNILNYRAGVSIGTTFYMPCINDENPVCFTLDLIHQKWFTHRLNLVDVSNLQSQITCAAVIKSKIYLVCGRLLNSYTLSNAIIEIDVDQNFNTKIIKQMHGHPPRPRHEHSVDSLNDRYLIVFGGLCYNSVGENDVFVYDTEENKWFVPPITGHLPHLRFGHASTVIGNDLYIHGGAQLENDSSYIVYDDLYKLDCDTWTWYKYEHPEVERYLRSQRTTSINQEQTFFIPTVGDNPFDRFQSYMCAYGQKLIIFGGHSIREDDQDNEILYSYTLDEISIFNTKRCTWSLVQASNGHDLSVADMSAALLVYPARKASIFILAAKKPAEISREIFDNKRRMSSSSNSEGQIQHHLPRIIESDSCGTDSNEENDEEYTNIETKRPRTTDKHAESVKRLVEVLDPDMMVKEESEESEASIVYYNSDHRSMFVDGPNDMPSTSSSSAPTKNRRRSSVSLYREELDNSRSHKRDSNSSQSSYSSASNGSLGKRKTKYKVQLKPFAILIDLVE